VLGTWSFDTLIDGQSILLTQNVAHAAANLKSVPMVSSGPIPSSRQALLTLEKIGRLEKKLAKAAVQSIDSAAGKHPHCDC
jgi:hypothetical protein